MPQSFDGQSASSCTCGIVASRRRHSSSSSIYSLSLAFPELADGKRSPDLQATEALVHASTANSLDRYILQPGQSSGHLHGLFTADKKNILDKDEKEKVRPLANGASEDIYN